MRGLLPKDDLFDRASEAYTEKSEIDAKMHFSEANFKMSENQGADDLAKKQSSPETKSPFENPKFLEELELQELDTLDLIEI